MAELSISIVPAKVLADGSHKIRIRVAHNNETRYIITRFKIESEKQFKNGRVVSHPEAQNINKKLSHILSKYYDVIDDITPESFTCTQLKEYLENQDKGTPSTTINEVWQTYISNLLDDSRKGTAGLHSLTKRYFEDKYGEKVLLIAFNANTVTGFERTLYKEHNLNDTSVGMHVKRLKVIINYAKKCGLVTYNVEPFAHYVLPQVCERELDITKEDLTKIRDSKPEAKVLIIARDLFMLSYYLGGINLIDLMQINFKGLNELTYIRQKTAHTKRGDKRISITIPPEAKPIIQHWSGADGKLDFKYNYTYDNFRNYITHAIKDLAASLGINKRVVYYSARKSFVQHGFELGIALEVLEYTIGQSVKKNRPIYNYIRFMRSHADNAIRKILDNIQ